MLQMLLALLRPPLEVFCGRKVKHVSETYIQQHLFSF